MKDLVKLLEEVRNGKVDPKTAASKIVRPDVELGYACLDIDRPRRKGFPEVIYCPGKTNSQIVKIAKALLKAEQNIFATRATAEQFKSVKKAFPKAVYNKHAGTITITIEPIHKKGLVAVVSAGTADIPIAEEAAVAAEQAGAKVHRVFDVGVAGLHRVMKHINDIRSANAVVVVAGMEGALPSVIGSLIDKPIFAVPTSTGYGAGAKGMAALLAMLNSCVPGVAVLNIDNGFGAGIAAALVNKLAVK